MNTLEETVALIARAQALSRLCWEQAIGPKKDRMATDCDEQYEYAIETLNDCYEAYLPVAAGHLENARRLEAAAGDDQHARAALAALADMDDEDPSMTAEDQDSEKVDCIYAAYAAYATQAA